MAKRRETKGVIDMGTPELSRRFTVVPRLSDPTTLAGKILDGSEVDKLLLHDVITPAEHGTLGTLLKKLHAFGFIGLKSPSYDGAIHADPAQVSAKKAELMRGAVSLFARMDRHRFIGPVTRKRLINLALYDAPWTSPAVALKQAVRGLDEIFSQRG
jgi:hypothetical protein